MIISSSSSSSPFPSSASSRCYGRRSSHFLLGLSLTLILVLFGSSFLVTSASSSSTQEDDDDDQDDLQDGVCDTTTTTAAAAAHAISDTLVDDNDAAQNDNLTRRQAHPDDPTLQLFHFTSVKSTQDVAKRIVEDDEMTAAKTFCVTTTEQTNGRGTSGRQWMGAKGNTFVTIGIPQQTWISSRIPLTLLPLKIGSLVARQVQDLLVLKRNNNHNNHDLVTVKWPNDVLVNEQKISGVLIESAKDWFLIGIGVNLAYAPVVPTSGPNHGRPATCLQNLCCDGSSSSSSHQVDWEDEAHQLGVRLAWELHEFLHGKNGKSSSNGNSNQRTANAVLKEWKSWVDWDMELVMRDTPNRERVKLIDVMPDGRVQVIGQDDGGVQRTLVSDYFL